MTLQLDVSTLRHDLVTPVNHIIGYCDLLIEDAERKKNPYRIRSISAVQDLGRRALAVIDMAMNLAVARGLPVDLDAMGRSLLVPCSAIMEACKAIEETSSRSRDRAELLGDLARVYEAAGQLMELAGHFTPGPMSDHRGEEA